MASKNSNNNDIMSSLGVRGATFILTTPNSNSPFYLSAPSKVVSENHHHLQQIRRCGFSTLSWPSVFSLAEHYFQLLLKSEKRHMQGFMIPAFKKYVYKKGDSFLRQQLRFWLWWWWWWWWRLPTEYIQLSHTTVSIKAAFYVLDFSSPHRLERTEKHGHIFMV